VAIDLPAGATAATDGSDMAQGSAGRCPACPGEVPAFAYARAAAVYAGPVRQAIHALKFGRRPAVGRVLGALVLEQCGQGLSGDVDAVVPVPLAADRLAERGFNQAALIAAPVARGLRVPLRARWLARVRSTRPQSELAASDRVANVAHAFRACPAARDAHVLLIDDVLTTGATASACARALGGVGARRVGVLTVARALRGTV
jgi:ComF family protein